MEKYPVVWRMVFSFYSHLLFCQTFIYYRQSVLDKSSWGIFLMFLWARKNKSMTLISSCSFSFNYHQSSSLCHQETFQDFVYSFLHGTASTFSLFLSLSLSLCVGGGIWKREVIGREIWIILKIFIIQRYFIKFRIHDCVFFLVWALFLFGYFTSFFFISGLIQERKLL